MPDSPRKKALYEYFSGIPEYKEKLEKAKLLGKKPDRLSPEITSALFGESMKTSYSRLEKMAGCPFSYFCTYTLNLSPEPFLYSLVDFQSVLPKCKLSLTTTS